MANSQVYDSSYDSALALIGMSGRFPGAQDTTAFWHNIAAGIKSIRFFSDEELLAAGVDPDLLSQPNYVKAGAPLQSIDQFDATFFGYTPFEARVMDPQHRLFLECSWEALEQAGYDPYTYRGLISVFAGSAFCSYLQHNLSPNQELMGSVGRLQIDVGNDRDSLASTVSYKLNLKGPAVAVQTFCSTSLVAVHLACQSLLSYESDIALAGGVSLQIPHYQGYLYEEGSILSPDGYCRTFDARAQGSVLGSGAGVVAIKRLREALDDGDFIYAIIRGSTINNDGSLHVSYAAPGVDGQASVILGALSYADVPAESISYIEAHGTATRLGDAVELAALRKAFAAQTEARQFCALGSVKPNVGHLDRAAGVAGLIKTALALQHQQLPPSIEFEQPSPEHDLSDSPFYVNTSLLPWPAGDGPRRAGVSSFGLGGTNAHVILEEAPTSAVGQPVGTRLIASGGQPQGIAPTSRPWQLLLLSAKTETALQEASRRLGEHLQQQEETSLADVAYTLQVGRAQFAYRQALVCQDTTDAIPALINSDPRRVYTMQQEHRDRGVSFLFPGVGEQFVGQTRELYEHEPVFRETVDQCCTLLKSYLEIPPANAAGRAVTPRFIVGGPYEVADRGCGLWQILYEEDPQVATTQHMAGRNGKINQNGINFKSLVRRNEASSAGPMERLKRTELSQPAVFVIEYALARLLMHWGIQPQAMLGYSLGEYVAACLAGVFSLEDALKLVARRAQLIQQVEPGAMIAVALSENSVQSYLDEQIALAAVNGPSTCVLAGPVDAIEMLEEQLADAGIITRRVETTHAFHSSMLESVKGPLTDLVHTIALHPPTIPYISNVTGTWITAEQATDPHYWAQHMCQTVYFAEGLSHLLQEHEHVLLEVGPGQSLSAFAKQHPACGQDRLAMIISTLPTVHEQQSDGISIATALGKLWLAGVSPDWKAFYANEQRQRVLLPTYPFERQRHWVDAPDGSQQQPNVVRSQKGKLKNIADWFYLPTWEQAPLRPVKQEQIELEQSPWLIFVDEGELGERITERLQQAGHCCVRVYSGSQFACHDEQHYTIRAGELNDYTALCKQLASTELVPHTVVHCWNVHAIDELIIGAENFERQQERGFYSLLFLAQALGAQVYEESVRMIVISNHMQAVTGQELVVPEKATIQAACRIIPQEQLTITCRSIDLASADASAINQRLIDQLVTECTTRTSDLVVAYRHYQRWTQAYKPIRLDAVGVEQMPFREQGVYLITGGLGGVGLILAEHLAKTVRAKLVITGRSGLPPKDEWSAWMDSHDATDAISQKIRQIQTIEAYGADVLVVKANAADIEQMQAAVGTAIEHFGALHGVFHAAGITSDDSFKLVQDTDRAACELQFQSKVYGLYALEQALQGVNLDFCLLFSSISTVLGGLGYLAYATANSFMDAYTYRHNQLSEIPWQCVNWDTWYKESASDARVTTVAEYVMQPDEGLDALQRALSNNHLTHLVNSTGDLQARLRQWTRLETSSSDGEQEQTDKRAGSARPNLTTAYVPAQDEYEQAIVDIWQKVLCIEPIGVNDNFFELGGHSLIGTQLISRMRQAFQINLPLTALFDTPTVAELATSIKLTLLEEIEQLDEEEALRLV